MVLSNDNLLFQLTFDFVRYHKIKAMRVKFDETVNKCVNYELITKYNLRGYSTIEYCAEPDLMVPYDWLDLTFAGIVLLLILIILSSSLYDRYVKNHSYAQDYLMQDYYKIAPESKSEWT